MILPEIAERLTLRDFMAEVRRTVGSAAAVSFYKTFDYQAIYYTGTGTSRSTTAPSQRTPHGIC